MNRFSDQCFTFICVLLSLSVTKNEMIAFSCRGAVANRIDPKSFNGIDFRRDMAELVRVMIRPMPTVGKRTVKEEETWQVKTF